MWLYREQEIWICHSKSKIFQRKSLDYYEKLYRDLCCDDLERPVVDVISILIQKNQRNNEDSRINIENLCFIMKNLLYCPMALYCFSDFVLLHDYRGSFCENIPNTYITYMCIQMSYTWMYEHPYYIYTWYTCLHIYTYIYIYRRSLYYIYIYYISMFVERSV